MKIKSVEPFVLHVPVTGSQIADSTHSITHWGVVGARIETEDGLAGYGFTGTHADLAGDHLITRCIATCHAPLLIGEDAGDVQRLWLKLARNPALQWIGRAGITTLAQAAIDVALWDLKAKQAGVPLWKLLGGQVRDQVRAYNTDIGWLSIDDEQAGAGRRARGGAGLQRHQDQGRFHASSATCAGSKRCAAPSGRTITLAIDGNGKWDLPTCLRFCRAAEAFDVYWFEEPLWYDDVKGHADLARATRIPVALGEQLYTQDAFAEFFHQRAVHWVQPDVTRMGGLTEVLARVRDRPFVPIARGAARRRHEPGARAPELCAPGLRGARIHPLDQGLLHRAGGSGRWILPAAAAARRRHHADAAGLGAVPPAGGLRPWPPPKRTSWAGRPVAGGCGSTG